MFTRKSLEKPVFLYLIIVLGACILSFGLYNIHERTGVTEGGVLGMTPVSYTHLPHDGHRRHHADRGESGAGHASR